MFAKTNQNNWTLKSKADCVKVEWVTTMNANKTLCATHNINSLNIYIKRHLHLQPGRGGGEWKALIHQYSQHFYWKENEKNKKGPLRSTRFNWFYPTDWHRLCIGKLLHCLFFKTAMDAVLHFWETNFSVACSSGREWRSLFISIDSYKNKMCVYERAHADVSLYMVHQG